MSALPGPIKMRWQQKLQLHQAHTLQCMRSEDFTYLYIRQAQHLERGIDHIATTKATVGMSDVDKQLTNINKTSAGYNELTFEEFKKDTEALKDSKPDEKAWHQKMTKKREEVKAKIIKTVDDSFNSAGEFIDTLDPSLQDAAYNGFETGVNYVMGAFQSVMQMASELIGKVKDFLQGIWTAITDAFNTVKNTVSKAIDWIGGIFSFASKGGSAITFTGEVVWQTTVTSKDASAAYCKICATLEAKSYVIDSQKFTKTRNGPSEATIVFRRTGKDASENSSTIWAQIVEASAGKAGTWLIPVDLNSVKDTVNALVPIIWLSRPMMAESEINHSLAYLKVTVDAALDDQYVCTFDKPVVQEGMAWKSILRVNEVDNSDLRRVVQIMKDVVLVEGKRDKPIADYPYLPTPDPVMAAMGEKGHIIERRGAKGRSGVPAAMKTGHSVTANGFGNGVSTVMDGY